MNIREILRMAAPVLPVLTIQDTDDAVPLAGALAAGGVRAVEITLRTPDAIEAIAAVRAAIPELVVGAGTVLTPRLMNAVREAGGQFAVSPGFTPTLAEAATAADLPFLPGVVTASELQTGVEHGLSTFKFFPAAAAGGPALLGNYASVFPDVCFCPTGGISARNMEDYLALANVVCVGGSWLAPANLIDAHDWKAITRRVTQALSANPMTGRG